MITAGAMNSQATRVCCQATRRSRRRASFRTSGLSMAEAVAIIGLSLGADAGRASRRGRRHGPYLLAQ